MQYGREGWVCYVKLGENSWKYAIGRGLKNTEGEWVVGDMQYERERPVIYSTYSRGGSAQGGRTRHDFSLAWLEAVWHCSGSGHGPTGNEPVQKMFCKLCNTLLPYFPNTEFKSAFNVYWHSGGAAGLSCTELSIWEFPFLRGVCWQGWTSILWEGDAPEGHPRQPAYTCMLCILSSSFTSVSIFSVSCYSIVSISVVVHHSWCYTVGEGGLWYTAREGWGWWFVYRVEVWGKPFGKHVFPQRCEWNLI
jgi:hypothetical protein